MSCHSHSQSEQEGCSHGSNASNPSVLQTLDELNFERGIWSAAADGDTDKVIRCLNKQGRDPNQVDSSGFMPLHYAGRNGHLKICADLLEAGAQVDAQTRSGGASTLHRAAYAGHTAVVHLLLNSGAQVGLRDFDGKTALHKAAEREHYEICELLLASDASAKNIVDNKSKLAVDYVISNNSLLELLSK